ncbi:phage portal protein [Paracoccus sp. MKU1]|uniref:phage portal protein n=1 Tax=Paracoccus sp. MKU1 TaxID=1745182 RepID=UPI0009EC6DF5|nr:phage portal protein [Paracoccus sp. MKU1]
MSKTSEVGRETRVRREGAPLVVVGTKADATDPVLEKVIRGEYVSQQIADPFSTSTLGGNSRQIIQPPFNFAALIKMADDNSVLKQCIDVMVTNVPGHGHRLEYVGESEQQDSAEAKAEAEFLRLFMKHPNEEYSMTELMRRVRWDVETIGNGYIEVARDKKKRISACWHVPGHLMRLTEVDRDPVQVEVIIPRADGAVKRKVWKQFRRYVQMRGTKKVYFKEFGDPRPIDPSTGEVNQSLSYEDTATEIIHRTIYHGGQAYGIPRWMHVTPSVMGTRQAELTNLDYFRQNAIPAMVITVAGGSITQASLTAIESHLTAVRGRMAQNRVVVIEAYGDEDAASDDGSIPPPQIELKSMSEYRPSDGLFLEYCKVETGKIRSAFRLPPIFVGLSEDYSHATAKASQEVAEAQVFGPERVSDEGMINQHIFGDYDLKHWEIRLNPPRITDPEDVLKALDALEKVGGMTPNIAIGIANELFDMNIATIKEEWGNFPFSVVRALAARGAVEGWDEILKSGVSLGAPGQAPGQAPQPGNSGTKPKEEQEDDTSKSIRDSLLTIRKRLVTDEAINASVRQRAPRAA